jgi:hypothetical protein
VATEGAAAERAIREGHDFMQQSQLADLEPAPSRYAMSGLAARLTVLGLQDAVARVRVGDLPDGGAMYQYPAWRVSLWQAM